MVNIANLLYQKCLWETYDANLAVIYVTLRKFVSEVIVTVIVTASRRFEQVSL